LYTFVWHSNEEVLEQVFLKERRRDGSIRSPTADDPQDIREKQDGEERMEVGFSSTLYYRIL
jgi:hypothetical protein